MAEFSEHDPRIADAIQRVRVEHPNVVQVLHDGQVGDLVVTVARALGVTTPAQQAGAHDAVEHVVAYLDALSMHPTAPDGDGATVAHVDIGYERTRITVGDLRALLAPAWAPEPAALPQAEPTTGYSIGTSAAGLTATPVGDPWSDPVIAAQIDAPANEVRADADRLTRQAHALRAIAAYLDTRDPATRAADQLEVAALNGEVRIARARDIARDLRAAVADATGDDPAPRGAS